MTVMADDILPIELGGEVVHWMDRGPMRFGSAGVPAVAVAGFALGLATAAAGFLLWRYLEPRREALPPWRWGRGSIH